jgi:hypothetical protein
MYSALADLTAWWVERKVEVHPTDFLLLLAEVIYPDLFPSQLPNI